MAKKDDEDEAGRKKLALQVRQRKLPDMDMVGWWGLPAGSRGRALPASPTPISISSAYLQEGLHCSVSSVQ
jgi:hypothetical protein